MTVSHVRSTRVDTGEIAEVLARSQSRKEAAAQLGIPATTLERLCREQALSALYEALAERGTRLRGGGKDVATKMKPTRRWSIYWQGVCVWPGKEIDAMTELEAVDVFMTIAPKRVARGDVTAVEVAK